MASSIDSDGSDSFSNGGSGSAASSNASSTPCKLIVAGAGDAKLVDEENDDAVEDLYSAGDVNGGSKMPVWNNPSNGALEVDPLMGESGQNVVSELLSHSTSDRPKHIFSHRKGNGPQQHGDSSYNNRYGSRKDQDRPNRDRNSQQSFNGRDVRPQPTGVVYSRNIRHIPMPHEFPLYYIPVQPESIRGTGSGIPNPAPALHHMFMQHFDPELYSKVIHQIDYYFSDENLVKDVYLPNNMDEQGWVPIQLIAGFKKVMRLTANVAFIVEAIRISTVVEVQNDKVRRRNDWMKWLMPESLKFPSQSSSQLTTILEVLVKLLHAFRKLTLKGGVLTFQVQYYHLVFRVTDQAAQNMCNKQYC
ncbi:hypothetical protein QQ045_016602 [Rhodiola kirilowii]